MEWNSNDMRGHLIRNTKISVIVGHDSKDEYFHQNITMIRYALNIIHSRVNTFSGRCLSSVCTSKPKGLAWNKGHNGANLEEAYVQVLISQSSWRWHQAHVAGSPAAWDGNITAPMKMSYAFGNFRGLISCSSCDISPSSMLIFEFWWVDCIQITF